MKTKLLFQTIYSVNQLSVLRSRGELVLSIRVYRRRKGTNQFLCGQQDVDQVETRRSTTLGISSQKSNWKQDARKSPELR